MVKREIYKIITKNSSYESEAWILDKKLLTSIKSSWDEIFTLNTLK